MRFQQLFAVQVVCFLVEETRVIQTSFADKPNKKYGCVSETKKVYKI